MATVLGRTDDRRRDDDLYNTDWRQKYLDLVETLAETRADLEEFQQSSKELEEEMTLELERTERAQQELKTKAARLESERDEWKGKFVTLQTTHNTATTTLHRELDTLRQQLQKSKIQLRELEIGNDDLERNERAVLSSLADAEVKYARVLEEKILLEQELLDKASLEEQLQRLKDELRDANEEISNLKRLLEQAQSSDEPSSDSGEVPTLLSKSPRPSLDDNILDTPPPSELLLSDLAIEVVKEGEPLSHMRPPAVPPKPRVTPGQSAQSALLSRAGFPATPALAASQMANSPSSLPRPSNLLSAPRTGPSTPKGLNLGRSVVARPSTSNVAVSQGIAAKSRGVQMISALRTRVQTTQQKLMPGIPRLRLGSNAGRTTNPLSSTIVGKPSSDGPNHRITAPKKSLDDTLGEPDRSSSPGWVFIQKQDDSPFPGTKYDERRSSSPNSATSSSSSHPPIPSSFKPMASTRGGPPLVGIPRRPPSRLSIGSEASPTVQSGRLTASSALARTSRPATPTFLPVPTYTHQAGPNTATSLSGSMYNPRRSSLGTSKRSVSPLPPSPTTATHLTTSRAMAASTRERPTSVPVPPRKMVNAQPLSGRTSALGQSRIGRPAGNDARRSTGGEPDEVPPSVLSNVDRGRLRAGSTADRSSRP